MQVEFYNQLPEFPYRWFGLAFGLELRPCRLFGLNF